MTNEERTHLAKVAWVEWRKHNGNGAEEMAKVAPVVAARSRPIMAIVSPSISTSAVVVASALTTVPFLIRVRIGSSWVAARCVSCGSDPVVSSMVAPERRAGA